ncbi:unnamed protein product [Prorocentrum cordatum]|uniref:Phospholipase B-like n=1 Tax=Prorocentrum cordatum TaxID=2364126 RepID=A0ABN9UAJ4_9DINO|nr:unnamed protein product [Polarella glacialis]
MKFHNALLLYCIGLVMSLVRKARRAAMTDEREVRAPRWQTDPWPPGKRWRATLQRGRDRPSPPVLSDEAEEKASRLEDSGGTTSEEDGNPFVQVRMLECEPHHARMAKEPGMQHVLVPGRSSAGERNWTQHRETYQSLVAHVDDYRLDTDKVQDFNVATVDFMTHRYMLGYDAGIGQKLIEAFLSYQPRFGGLAPSTMGVDSTWRAHAHRSDPHQGSKVGNQSSSILWKTQGFDLYGRFSSDSSRRDR